jgi:hypothetical protein
VTEPTAPRVGAGPDDDERHWVLPRREPLDPARGAAFAVLVWFPGALAGLLWETHTLVTRSWPAIVNLTTVDALLMAGWTGIGVAVLRRYVEEHDADLVTVGRGRVRVDRVTRGGRRPRFEVAYADLRDLHDTRDRLRLETADGLKDVAGTGTPAQRDEIVDHVQARLAPREGEVRPPVVSGWRAYRDDRGRTLCRDAADRRHEAWWCAGGAAVVWTNSVAFFHGGFLPFAVAGAVAGAGLARGAFRRFRTTPRWTARRGAVVRTGRPGAEPAFRAHAVELVDTKDEHGSVTHVLHAVADRVPHPGSKRERILVAGPDGEPLAEAGRWLAGGAGVEFLDLREHRR